MLYLALPNARWQAQPTQLALVALAGTEPETQEVPQGRGVQDSSDKFRDFGGFHQFLCKMFKA